MTTEDIKTKLFSRKAADRLSAAKRIRKDNLTTFSQDLFSAWTKEKEDLRSREVKSEMLRALGRISFKPVLPEVAEIIRRNLEHDALTIHAAVAYVQLKRGSVNDGSPVLELLAIGGMPVITGAFMALSTDRMIPDTTDTREIIRFAWNGNLHAGSTHQEYGFAGPLHYVANACAGWDKQLTTGFLHHCIATARNISQSGVPLEDRTLIEVARRALSGRYSNLD